MLIGQIPACLPTCWRFWLFPAALRGAEPGDAVAVAKQKGGPSAAKTEPWGTMPDGKVVNLTTLTNRNGLRVKIADRGAAIVSVETPDRAGNVANVTLGPETFQVYAAGRGSVGPTLGRYANRIAGGKFTIDGVEYTLAKNNGPNHLHGGNVGFDRVTWTGSDERGRRIGGRDADLPQPRRRGGLSRQSRRNRPLHAERR